MKKRIARISRISRIVRIGAISLLVAVPALADAPAQQYAAFTDTDTQITDTKTKLVWQRTATEAVNFTGAEIVCDTRGQRLPTIKELLTLVDEEPHKEYAGSSEVTLYIDQNAFGGTDSSGNSITPTDTAYWTQTPVNGSSAMVWSLDFSSAAMTAASTATTSPNVLHVRCVSNIP